MKRLGVFVLLTAAVALVPAAMETGAQSADTAYVYPPSGWYPGVGDLTAIDRIPEVLESIDSPSRRSDLAEQWLQFSRQAIAKNLEFRDQWLALQRQQYSQQRQVEQFRMEVYRLQMQIEQLRAENLRLERENLMLQLQVNDKTLPPEPNEPATANPAP